MKKLKVKVTCTSLFEHRWISSRNVDSSHKCIATHTNCRTTPNLGPFLISTHTHTHKMCRWNMCHHAHISTYARFSASMLCFQELHIVTVSQHINTTQKLRGVRKFLHSYFLPLNCFCTHTHHCGALMLFKVARLCSKLVSYYEQSI